MPLAIRSDINSILKIDDDSESTRPKSAKKPEKVKLRPVGRPPKDKSVKNKSEIKTLPILEGVPGYKGTVIRKTNIKARRWHLVPFKTPGRSDNTRFYHWERVENVYNSPFTKAYENELEIPRYSDEEYYEFLCDPDWNKEETDYLLECLERYNLRFIVVADRWDTEKFSPRPVEEIKERYYNIKNAFFKARNNSGESSPYVYDREHEKKRRHQLNLLLSRTPEDEAEEEMLIHELKKIESRRRGHERKTQDLQSMIKIADVGVDIRKNDKKITKKRPCIRPRNLSSVVSDNNLIRFTEIKAPAIYVSSQKIKLPNTMGNKMVKLIEETLSELKVDATLISSEERSTVFNELRQNIVLMHELKVTLSGCELELSSLRHQYETSIAGKNTSAILNDSLNEWIQLPQSEIQSDIIHSPDLESQKRRRCDSDKTDNKRKRA